MPPPASSSTGSPRAGRHACGGYALPPRRRGAAIGPGELSEGTIPVFVALAGMEVGGGTAARWAAPILLASAVATAVAHSYAGFVGRRLVEGQPLATRDVIAALKADSPV